MHNLWRINVVHAVLELRPTVSIESETMLVSLTVVVPWHVRHMLAYIAGSLLALLNERKLRVDVGLAPCTAERARLIEVSIRNLVGALGVVVLRRLGQRLNHYAEFNATLILHILISRCRHDCWPEKPRRSLALVI